ncbi:MAG: RidA family protein [Alphaproteobacteria bacterium]|nr:RidA family protein [Alphaproteobacteria bacterium]MCB9928331.1 RidA family protein [Alphaproteobacteria bacterium]
MATLQPYAAPGVFDPPAYAQAIKVTGASTLIVLSGQVDYDAQGGVANPGDMKAQALACFRHVKAQVEAGGGSIRNIVRLNVYVTDMGKVADYRAARAEVFGDLKVASTLVGVTALAQPGFVIEVEAIAAF